MLEPKKWWEHLAFPDMSGDCNYDIEWARRAMFAGAVRGGPTAMWNRFSGTPLMKFEDILAEFAKMGGRVVYLHGHPSGDGSRTIAWHDTMVEFCGNSFEFCTTSNVMVSAFSELAARCFGPSPECEPTVDAIIGDASGYSTHSVEIRSTPLERGNYTPEVIEAYDHVVADLSSDAPCGRIVLLNGPPGSGKTFLVRSLLRVAPNVKTILVPAQLVEDLNGPALMKMLIGVRACHAGPILMVVEDADAALAQRKATNMGAISTLLNLSDGLIGGLFDLRILATTNQPKLEIDEAILRPGRLCRHIHVGPLEARHAAGVFVRLAGSGTRYPGEGPKTLAEVYGMARGAGWSPKKSETVDMPSSVRVELR